ncbi:RNA methyltransferase [Nitrosomonas sp. Nm33]|uniref:TrmH family RNA methyltransferase n=1 Tax=Nitrosomonas sp. Nm33 TaxID=133724 RepID=UPI00089D94DB|nr:RNA methyltransferase [Nitrosomonas sp. Nm33]SDY30872.1 RNA methyltransferase, TrmH family [Nitrosomonas sp. Nm33]
MYPITSREHALFKQLVKLEKSSRLRRLKGLTLLDGVHLIQVYHAREQIPLKLIVSESGYDHAEIKHLIRELSRQAGIDTIMFSDALFKQVSPVRTPTGILALIAIPTCESNAIDDSQVFCALLEAIQDPGNLGSMLRSAAAAGVNDVYLSNDCADAWSPKTLRAAMGGHFSLTIHEQSNLVQVAQQFHGKVIATTLQATQHLYQTDLKGPVAFLFGNEGAGLSQEILRAVSERVTIPMPGNTESLNAAAAAAICFFEKVRQQYY